ncbi:MAG: hypothetical protein U9Q38_03150 [Thermodesulfobacteriota bacterium]|nr:hypothetical protein [Thermodesulfobacteriota bacterium]
MKKYVSAISVKDQKLNEKRIKSWALYPGQSLFEDGVDVKKTTEEKKLEEKFKPENFDLITWFVVSD